MSLPGYDAWKLRCPEDEPGYYDHGTCEHCGGPTERRGRYWVCDRCDDAEPPEPDAFDEDDYGACDEDWSGE